MAFFYSADLPSGFSKCVSSSGLVLLVLISVYPAPSHTLALPLISVFSFQLLGLSVVYIIANYSLGQATSLAHSLKTVVQDFTTARYPFSSTVNP